MMDKKWELQGYQAYDPSMSLSDTFDERLYTHKQMAKIKRGWYKAEMEYDDRQLSQKAMDEVEALKTELLKNLNSNTINLIEQLIVKIIQRDKVQ